jgi:predicted nucleic acid-binding protein
MILVDTSVWIDVDRRRQPELTDRVTELVADNGAAYTEPVAMELLAGVDSGARIRRVLDGLPRLGFDSSIDFTAAAWIYRECAKRGTTPRGTIDCMIASVAIRNNVPLLAADRDFAAIAAVTDLRLVSA